MKDNILIVGGYGHVGRYVTMELTKLFPQKIIVAGRDPKKAAAFAAEQINTFKTLKLDIYDKENVSLAVKDIRVVVMCLTPLNTDFVEYCIKNGIHYIDISPSVDVTKKITNFKEDAKNNNSTCVLGVGLSPGLSNLLVKELSQKADSLLSVNISLLLGLGDELGEDGLRWFLDNIQHDKKTFRQKYKTVFPEPLGKRTAYHYNLADQFIVQQTLEVKNASSYFCYDSRFMTAFVSILKRFGVFGLLKYKSGYNFLLKLFMSSLSATQKTKSGTDIFGLQVDAVGLRNGKEIPLYIGLTGFNNALLTGQVAAFTAMKLFIEEYSSGVFYFEDLFFLSDIIEICKNQKVSFS